MCRTAQLGLGAEVVDADKHRLLPTTATHTQHTDHRHTFTDTRPDSIRHIHRHMTQTASDTALVLRWFRPSPRGFPSLIELVHYQSQGTYSQSFDVDLSLQVDQVK